MSVANDQQSGSAIAPGRTEFPVPGTDGKYSVVLERGVRLNAGVVLGARFDVWVSSMYKGATCRVWEQYGFTDAEKARAAANSSWAQIKAGKRP